MKLTEVKFDPYALHDVQSSQEASVPKLGNPDKIAEYIRKTSPTMARFAEKNQYFYRGMAGPFARPALFTSVRKNRLPVEMELERHYALVDVFKEAKLKVNRSNSIFVSTLEKIASSWGKVYVVFPKEPWTGLYFFDQVDDYSFYKMRSIGKKWLDDRKDEALSDLKSLGPTEFNQGDSATINKIFNRQQYEVLIDCEDYLALDPESDLFDEVREALDS